jgi:hypothetical protein
LNLKPVLTKVLLVIAPTIAITTATIIKKFIYYLQGKKMNNLFKPATLISLSVLGSSTVQAHNSDGSISSAFHFITAPDHLGLAALLTVLLSATYLRLQKSKTIRATKK